MDCRVERGGFDDTVRRDDVVVRAVHRRDGDEIAGPEFIEPEERRRVGRSVTFESDISGRAWQRCARVVSDSVPQDLAGDPLAYVDA
jgi:hypothetical protein